MILAVPIDETAKEKEEDKGNDDSQQPAEQDFKPLAEGTELIHGTVVLLVQPDAARWLYRLAQRLPLPEVRLGGSPHDRCIHDLRNVQPIQFVQLCCHPLELPPMPAVPVLARIGQIVVDHLVAHDVTHLCLRHVVAVRQRDHRYLRPVLLIPEVSAGSGRVQNLKGRHWQRTAEVLPIALLEEHIHIVERDDHSLTPARSSPWSVPRPCASTALSNC